MELETRKNMRRGVSTIEISKNLPMRVKDLAGMFKGEIIRFYEINSTGKMLGHVVGDAGKKVAVVLLTPGESSYETIH